MSHPYDASTKFLLQDRLADWLPVVGRSTTAELEVIDADLSTVSAAADRVLRVGDDPPWLLHIEMLASREVKVLANLPVYNVLLKRRHGLRVQSVAVLLRPSAQWAALTGTIEEGFPGRPPYLTFRYEVVRIWELPPSVFLQGGLGILPLAPLSDVADSELADVIRRMDERIRAEAAPADAAALWTAADVLMGLRYPPDLISQLLRGVLGMGIHGIEESLTYRAIIEKGQARGEVLGEARGEARGIARARREDLLIIGQDQLGAADAETEKALNAISDADRLSRMIRALRHSSSWKDVLAIT